MQQKFDGADPVRKTQRPRAVVLVPTRELAVQVLEVAKRLSRSCKFSSCGVIGGEEYGKQKRQLAGTVDLVVASPGEMSPSWGLSCSGCGTSRSIEMDIYVFICPVSVEYYPVFRASLRS